MRTFAKCGWLALLALGSGAPNGVVNKAARVWLARTGASDAAIGSVTAAVLLAYTLKFLWAPAVDRFGARRAWAFASQALAAACLVVLAGAPSWAALLLVAIAYLSATFDVAVDGYAVELLDRREMGLANGVRVAAWRGGFLLTAGLLVAGAEPLGWPGVFRVAAILLGLLGTAALFAPRVPKAPAPGIPLVEPLRRFAGRRGAGVFAAVAAFVVLFKFGDFAMAAMIEPFLVRGAGLSDAEIGLVQTTVAVAATVAGTLVGGWLTTRHGIFRALWTLGLLQALSNLAYAAAAHTGVREHVWYAIVLEPYCGGLGTAAFLAFLMASCERAHAATQYALLSALFGLGNAGAAFVSGHLAQRLGYAHYFALTTLLALPALALLPAVRRWLGEDSRPDRA